MINRCLLIGAGGQLGSQLAKDLNGEVMPVTRDQLDLSDPNKDSIGIKLMGMLDMFQPDLLINAAAYTAVDRAQDRVELADQVNAWFPGLLGRVAGKMPVLHFSTDYVFSGIGDRPYREDDTPGPLGVYGLSKLKGELALLESNPRATVLRCSWVIGSRGENFVKSMLRLACEKEQLRVVNDQFGVPTSTTFLTEQVNRWLLSLMPAGLYHVVPSGETNWHQFALWIVEKAFFHHRWRDRLRVGTSDILGISSDQYPMVARRPLNSRLDTSKWRNITGQKQLADWKMALETVINDILDEENT